MKTVLVTGGSGFIGHHLCKALADKGYSVTAIDRASNFYRPNDYINFMLYDIKKVKLSRDFDYVYHLATDINNDEMISNDIEMTYKLTQQSACSRIVYTSSYIALEPLSPYGLVKRTCEHFINLHKNSISVRLPEIFGEESWDNDVNYFGLALQNKYNATVVDNRIVDYVYVHDCVNELIRLGESKIRGVTDTGYGTPLHRSEVYELMARIFKVRPRIKVHPARKGDLKRYASKFKIKEPQYGLTEGLRRTIKWHTARGLYDEKGTTT